MATVKVHTRVACDVCRGKAFVRLNHAAVSTCWNCNDGAIHWHDTEIWTSYERALTDHDPFQSGAHTTMPTWYVGKQLDYMGL